MLPAASGGCNDCRVTPRSSPAQPIQAQQEALMNKRVSIFTKILAACFVAAVCKPALCAVDAFHIRDLYSSQDGDLQYIELEEVAGKDGQDQFAGLTLTVI